MIEFIRDNWHIAMIIFMAGGLAVNVKYLLNHNRHINHKVELLFDKYDTLNQQLDDFKTGIKEDIATIKEWQRLFEKKFNGYAIK